MRHCVLCTLTVLACWPLSALGLAIGDKAPDLKIDSWVKGNPIDLASGKGKQVFVLEFWATWCRPCLDTIPHLTELQRKHKDKLVIIGISDETTAEVRPFVEKMADKMDYRVALDKRDATSRAYMGGFQVNGIPHAFVVDTSGSIVWHGHPGSGMDRILERVLAGKYDVKAAKDAAKAREIAENYAKSLEQAGRTDVLEERKRLEKKAGQLGQDVVKLANEDEGLLNDFAWMILVHPGFKNRDLALATQAAKRANELTEGKDWSVLDTYARVLHAVGNPAEAVKTQKKAIELCPDKRIADELRKALADFEKAAATQPASRPAR